MLFLDDVRGKHNGEDVFIFGSGPSLHSFDMSIVRDRPTIAINSALVKVKNPTYYFTCDGFQRYWNHWDSVKSGNFTKALCIDSYSKADIQDENMLLFERKERGDVSMSEDDSALIFGIGSIHCAVHFAVLLGARRIILVGADCRYIDGHKYFYEFDSEPEKDFIVGAIQEPEYCRNIAVNKNSDGFLCGSFNHFQSIQSANPELKIEVFGGKLLEIYPKYKGD